MQKKNHKFLHLHLVTHKDSFSGMKVDTHRFDHNHPLKDLALPLSLDHTTQITDQENLVSKIFDHQLVVAPPLSVGSDLITMGQEQGDRLMRNVNSQEIRTFIGDLKMNHHHHLYAIHA